MVPPKLAPPKKRQPRLNTQIANDDERDEPILPAQKKLAPYPSKQLFVLACCRFSEPVAMTSSFPYLFFMIRDFHLTDDEKKIGSYAGFLASSFSFAQFVSGLPWGRLSDFYGRKPMIVCGLLGTVLATLAFGFSTTFTQAVIARTGAGLLNGNVGVIRTMVAEMVVERAHQARAFSVMPFVWSLGSILGPILGGALADPARQYPQAFGNSKFFLKFPYALPNIVTAGFLFVSAFFGFLFMQETLDSKKDQIDLGIRFRRFIHRIFKSCITLCIRRKKIPKARQRTNSRASEVSEFSSDDEEGYTRGHRRRGSEEPMLLSPATKQNSRRPSAYYRYRRRSSSFSALVRPTIIADQPPPPRFSDILTKQVVVNMVVYSGLALHTICFDQLFPLLCSTQIQDGGLGMTAGQIGAALSVAGVMAMILQITVFPWGHNKFGGLFCLRVVLGMYAILYSCIPFLPKIQTGPEFENSPAIWGGIFLVLLIKLFCGVFAFPICAILITQSSPSRELLGTVNGANQALGSLCRAIGPSIAGVMYTRSLEVSKPWIVWRYGLGIFSIVVWLGGWFLTDENQLPNAKDYTPVERDEEDIIEEEIEEEEDRLWREEEDGIFDVEDLASQGKHDERKKVRKDDSDESSDDEFVQGVSNHLLSREH